MVCKLCEHGAHKLIEGLCPSCFEWSERVAGEPAMRAPNYFTPDVE